MHTKNLHISLVLPTIFGPIYLLWSPVILVADHYHNNNLGSLTASGMSHAEFEKGKHWFGRVTERVHQGRGKEMCS